MMRPLGRTSVTLPVHLLAAVLLSVLSGCGDDGPEVATEGCPSACGAPTERGAIIGGAVAECSGAVAGATHPEVLYVHNDGNDGARFFAIGVDGVARGEFAVSGATAVDWEDVARGPCSPGGQSCLFFGDIGDNDGTRASYVIYEVPEPADIGAGMHAASAAAIPFVYPDGSHDAETLLVHPVTGAITIVTKIESGKPRIYELAAPVAGGAAATLVERGTVEPPDNSDTVTAGDVRADGRGVLIRTRTDVWFYSMTPDRTVAEALSAPPCRLPAANEDQGEAIAWLPGGWDYVTLGEGLGAPIHGVSCSPP